MTLLDELADLCESRAQGWFERANAGTTATTIDLHSIDQGLELLTRSAALRTRSTQEGGARHMSDWLDDKREIHGAKLAGNGEWYQRLGGDGFERIEQPGEYCMLPWMRVTTWRSGSERIIEAPLTQVEFIEYSRSTQEGDKG